MDPVTKAEVPSENFVELLVRMNEVLVKLNQRAKSLEVSERGQHICYGDGCNLKMLKFD